MSLPSENTELSESMPRKTRLYLFLSAWFRISCHRYVPWSAPNQVSGNSNLHPVYRMDNKTVSQLPLYHLINGPIIRSKTVLLSLGFSHTTQGASHPQGRPHLPMFIVPAQSRSAYTFLRYYNVLLLFFVLLITNATEHIIHSFYYLSTTFYFFFVPVV